MESIKLSTAIPHALSMLCDFEIPKMCSNSKVLAQLGLKYFVCSASRARATREASKIPYKAALREKVQSDSFKPYFETTYRPCKRSHIHSIASNMSAAQLLNPKAESRVWSVSETTDCHPNTKEMEYRDEVKLFEST